MTNKSIPHDYCTTSFANFQLFLPMDISVNIPDNAPVRVISKVLEGLDYSKLMQAYSDNKGRRAKIEPHIMFFIIAYAMYDGVNSTRAIEKSCRENINFMWILRGKSAPDHNTIARFINHNADIIEELFYQFVKRLMELNETDMENIFIDGTKIEANANRYTFVWKKAVLKNYDKMKKKEAEFWADFNERNNLESDNVYEIKEYIERKMEEEGIEVKRGRGNKKTQIQKDYEEVSLYISREAEYLKHLHICGKRNSYSKTDNDATFMRMKDDYMRNGQLKPAYNLQMGVNSEYIVGLDVFPNPGDVKTLPAFLSMLESRNLKFKNVVADAGYESEENYEYLKLNGYTPYIKPQAYEKQKTRKFRNDISRVENMQYDEEKDSFACSEGRELKYIKTLKRKNETGYISEKKVYECQNCTDCKMSDKCKNSTGNKKIYVAMNFMNCRKESYENITSEKGIELRVNRSIQVEGAFGVLKQNMKFKRLKYRKRKKVKTEVLLYSLGYNLRKYVHKMEQERQGMKLHRIKVS